LVSSQIKWQSLLNNYSNLGAGNVTLFEQTTKAGLRGIGIFSHFYFTPDRGISKGMAEWSNDGALSIHDSNLDSAAPRIVPRVVARLDKAAQKKERFLLWTHLFEPHSSYMSHAEFPVRAGAPLMDKYDAECSFVDKYIGQILDALGRAGLADNTAVIVFSDHGESFGEHHFFFHGETIYEEVERVPLIFHVPGIAPRQVPGPAMLIDVAPTIVDLLHGEIPPSFRGMSLLGAMLGDATIPKTRRAYTEMLPAHAWMHHQKAMVDGDWKLYYRVSDNGYELYDLAGDPGEQHNLWQRDVAKSNEMKRKMLDWMEGELAGS
jgi:arylsulfatase A-like enzyme